MNAKAEQSLATPVVVLNGDVASKLGLAYYGLPKQRQEAVDAAIKEEGLSRTQAVFNEICNNRILMYAKQGEQEQHKVLEEALQVMRNLGMGEEDARIRLGLPAK